jgi:nitroreductase
MKEKLKSKYTLNYFMEIHRAIQTLGSTKKYLDKEIDWAKLTDILDSIKYTPSAGEIPNWKLLVVKDKKTRKEIAKVSADQLWIASAPVLLVVCNDQSEMERMFKDKADYYSTQSCAAGIQNILLMANSVGVDHAWVRTFNAERIRSILKIPEEIKIDALITLGYADERERKPRKTESRNVVYFEEWEKTEL